MGHTEGKNGILIAIRMRIHQNFSSSMTDPHGLEKKTGAGGYAQISDCYVVYLLLLLYCGAIVGCADLSKN